MKAFHCQGGKLLAVKRRDTLHRIYLIDIHTHFTQKTLQSRSCARYNSSSRAREKKTSLLHLLCLCSTKLFLSKELQKNCTHTFLYLTVGLDSLFSHPSVSEVDLGFIWLKTSEKVKLS